MKQKIKEAMERIDATGRGPLRHGMYLPLDSEHAAFPMEKSEEDQNGNETDLEPNVMSAEFEET